MSLDYSLKNIENWKELCYGEDGFISPVTEGIIFGCITTGIGVLNDRTLPEWYARHAIWSLILKFDPIEYEVLEAHKGLSTNVFPEESRSKWLKRVIGGELDDFKRRIPKEKETV